MVNQFDAACDIVNDFYHVGGSRRGEKRHRERKIDGAGAVGFAERYDAAGVFDRCGAGRGEALTRDRHTATPDAGVR
jgi:hypothetical protein